MEEINENNSIFNSKLPIELTNLTSLLINLSNQIISTRLNSNSNSNSTPNYETLINSPIEQEEEEINFSEFLINASPIFANLNLLNRNNLIKIKELKSKVNEVKLGMDISHLRLQNLLFERNHLEREIKNCQEFESEYQNLPILPIEEFKSLQNSMEPPLGITKMEPSAEDDESIQEVEHKLMLARLSFELFERKRLDEEKRILNVRKRELTKLNESKKLMLEELEKKVVKFVLNAKEIQAKMHA